MTMYKLYSVPHKTQVLSALILKIVCICIQFFSNAISSCFDMTTLADVFFPNFVIII